MNQIQKITPFLWFDDQAEEAANFYISIFDNSKIIDKNQMMVNFELEGLKLIGLNGGKYFKFNEAISLFVSCEDQDEVDRLWQKLSAVPESEQCGWLKDKYGLSWQIVPKQLGEYLQKDKSGKVMEAMLKMKKIIVDDLKKAYEQNNN